MVQEMSGSSSQNQDLTPAPGPSIRLLPTRASMTSPYRPFLPLATTSSDLRSSLFTRQMQRSQPILRVAHSYTWSVSNSRSLVAAALFVPPHPLQHLEWSLSESWLIKFQTLPAGVAIPGAYKETDPGIVFNLYGTFTSYTIPGPAVWNAAAGGSTGTSPPPSNSTNAPAASSPAAPVPTGVPGGASTTSVYACSSTMSTVVGAAPSGAAVAGVSAAVAKYSQWHVSFSPHLPWHFNNVEI
jgi:hypothetical protein